MSKIDEAVEAMQDAYHEFVFGPEEPLSSRDKGITKQAEKVSLLAALDVLLNQEELANTIEKAAKAWPKSDVNNVLAQYIAKDIIFHLRGGES